MKGILLKLRGGSKYIVVDQVKNEFNEKAFLLIKVSTVYNRFNIKKKFVISEKYLKNLIEKNLIENINIDKRDLKIFNEFKEYIINNKFNITCDVREHQYYLTRKRKETYTYFFNINLNNFSLKGFKQYSNRV